MSYNSIANRAILLNKKEQLDRPYDVKIILNKL